MRKVVVHMTCESVLFSESPCNDDLEPFDCAKVLLVLRANLFRDSPQLLELRGRAETTIPTPRGTRSPAAL